MQDSGQIIHMPSKASSIAKVAPDLNFESRFRGYVCGVDEAGRGPLSGPVVACAVILDRTQIPQGLNDSKILSHSVREHLLNAIRQTAMVGIGIAEPEEIDRINVLAATMAAMQRAVDNLPVRADAALIDGNRTPVLPCETLTIVKGDSKSLSIAAASIVAKQVRDAMMREAAGRFPGYDLGRHKGYPTAAHRAALQTLGPAPISRYSYAPVKAAAQAR